MIRSLIAGLLCSSSAALGQPFTAGIVAGAGVTQDFQNKSLNYGTGPIFLAYSTPKRYLIGAMFEANLPLHLSVEVDGLYRELEYTNATLETNGTLNSVSPAPVVTWEFPILVKYRFSTKIIKPFVEAGPSFRSSGNLNGTAPSTHGFAAGVGAETRLWKMGLAPQIRFIRWARDSPREYGSSAPITVQDQVEVSVEFFFRYH